MFIISFGLGFALLGAASAAVVEVATSPKSSSITHTTATKASSTFTTRVSSGPTSTSVADGGSTYTIDFINLTGTNNEYGFFLAPPIAPGIPESSIWTNTWIAESVVNNVGIKLQLIDTFYAVIGTAPEPLSPGVTFSMEESTIVSLGATKLNGTTLETDDYGEGYPTFYQPPPTPWAGPGTFQINTGTNFTYSSDFILGMGALGNDGETVVPVGIIQMQPNLDYTFQPVVQFYVSQGTYIPGQLLNIESVSGTAGFCDFVTNPACNTCAVQQNPNGQFSVTYTNSGAPCQT